MTFDERPGEWMFHCHILDHADGGLMGTVLVGPVTPGEHAHGTAAVTCLPPSAFAKAGYLTVGQAIADGMRSRIRFGRVS